MQNSWNKAALSSSHSLHQVHFDGNGFLLSTNYTETQRRNHVLKQTNMLRHFLPGCSQLNKCCTQPATAATAANKT